MQVQDHPHRHRLLLITIFPSPRGIRNVNQFLRLGLLAQIPLLRLSLLLSPIMGIEIHHLMDQGAVASPLPVQNLTQRISEHETL